MISIASKKSYLQGEKTKISQPTKQQEYNWLNQKQNTLQK